MESEILESLLLINVAASSAIVFVFVARDWIRRRFGSHAAYALWIVVPIAVTACLLPARQIVVPQSSASPSERHVGYQIVDTGSLADELERQESADANPMTVESTAWLSFAARSVLIVWVLGLILCLSVFAKRQRRFLQMLGHLTPHRVLGRRVYLCQHNSFGPMTVGVVRPKIVLPVNFRARYCRDELELILLHESAHVASNDTLINFLASVACCLCWFNPVVRVGARLFRDDQELARDADVINRRPAKRRRYAETLLRSQMSDLFPELGCAWSPKSSLPLKRRVSLLATPHHCSKNRQRCGAILISIIGFAFGAAAWSLQPPDIVLRPTTKFSAGESEIFASGGTPDDSDIVAYPARSLEIRNTVANVVVIPEDRNDIALRISSSTVLPEISVYMEASQVVIDGGIDLARSPCTRKYDDHIIVDIPGVGQRESHSLPTIFAYVPQTLSLSTHGIVKAKIGPSFGGHVENHGCGVMVVGPATGNLTVALFGHGDVETANVTAAIDAALFGTGDLTVGDGTDAKLQLLGTGNLVSGHYANNVSATLGGEGDISIAAAGQSANLTLSGIGDIRVGDIYGHVDVLNSGTGQIAIESVGSMRVNALIRGAGSLNIRGGSTDKLDVTIYGEGDVRFDGVAQLLRADVSFGGGKVVVTDAMDIQTSARIDRSFGDVRVLR